MAKHGKGGFRRYLRGQFNDAVSLGTLAGGVLISDVLSDTVTEKAYCSSARATWTMDNYTKANNDGPILVGWAHSDYTDSEIEAWVENQGSWEETDQIGQEVGRRKCRLVGAFDAPIDPASTARLNDGKPITTKLGWMLTTGQTLRQWAYNSGSSALATTDPTVRVQGHANLWPK